MRSPSPQLLGPNDVLVSGPTTACHLRASQISELRLLCFQILPELLVGVLSAIERQYFTEFKPDHEQSLRVFGNDTALAQQFEKLGVPTASQPQLHHRCRMLLIASIILGEYLLQREEVASRAFSARARFEKLFAEMPEAELQYCSPEELALQCGCSVRHFSR